MSKYLMTFPKSDASVLLEFCDMGFLVKYELDAGTFDDKQFNFFFQRFPKTIAILNAWKEQQYSFLKIKLVEEDLSFENFYNLYNHKVSKKKRSQDIWETMPDTERAKAIKFIGIYDQRLRQTSINKKYPESYLNAQEWNN